MSSFDHRDQLRAGRRAEWKLGRRQIDIDFHFSETARNMLVDTDPKAMMQAVAATGADSVMVYAKDHWGHVYHQTSIAHQHSAMKGDFLREWLSEAKSLGLQTTVFFSLMWDEFAGRQNPDWLGRNADGSVKRWYGGWRFLSLNSPYRDYIFAHMSELVANYDFDTIFVDPFNHRMGVNVPDYNEYDQRLFRAQYGRDIPPVLHGEDKAQYMEFRDQFFSRFLRELYGLIRASGKDIKITHIYGGNTDYDDYLNVEGDPFGQDYYAPSMKAKVYRSYAEGRPLVMLTERFARYWDFVPKPREQLVWETATAFAHKASMMVVDHADVHGRLDSAAYADLGATFRQLESFDDAVQASGDVFADIALLYGERDEELVLEQKAVSTSPDEQHLSTVYRGYIPEFVGAFKFLTETHLPFDTIVQKQLTPEALARFKVLVIPGTVHMSAEEVEAVRDYVANGGNLLFSYRSASRDLQTRLHTKDRQLFGLVDLDIEDPYSVRYVSPQYDCGIPYIRVNGANAYVSARGDADVLGYVQLTAVERTPDRWVTHNEPPGELTDRPAVLHGKHGKGQFVYFSYQMFTELVEQDISGYREFVSGALSRLCRPEVRVVGSRLVEANYYAEGSHYTVALTALTPGRQAGRYDLVTPTPEPYSYPSNMEEALPIPNISIEVVGPVSSAKDENGNVLSVEEREGRSIVALPPVTTYSLVTFDR